MARQDRQQTIIKFSFTVLLCFVVIILFVAFLHIPSKPNLLFAQSLASSQQTLGEDNITSCTIPHVITHGDRTQKKIALTFDADMTVGMKENLETGKVKSYINRELISFLENTQIKATLFLTGLWIETYPEETKSLAENSLFELANHSYDHPSFEGYCYGLPQMSKGKMSYEVDQTQKLLKSVAGVTNTYFRFPGGCVSQSAMDYLASQGMQVVHWDVVGDDGFNNNTENIIKNVVDHVQNGSIIVMHMNGAPNDPKTTEALPSIISALKAKGYEFVKVSELLQ